MKPLFTLLLAALAFVATAQPQKIHYQGVAVGANGKPIKNSTVGLRLSVLDSLPTGSTLYTETQAASTDAAGQFSIFLGGGTATAGTFANLPWANGNDKFLKVEMDAQGGNNYQPMGTTQLVSVPYAMAAGTAMVIDEGTLLRMKNGHIYRLDYPLNGQGPVWNAIGGVTQATISQDTIYTCSDSIWIYGNRVKSNEYSQWHLSHPFSLVGNVNMSEVDSMQVFRHWSDTLVFNYLIFPYGNYAVSVVPSDKVTVIFIPNTSSSAGPDQLNLAGTTATLVANAPAAGETGAWSILAGSGGSISASNTPTAMFTKGTDSAYTLVWTMTGPCGTTFDTVNLRFPALVDTTCGQAVNYSGESYPTVRIGTQCWFAKNLNVGTMISSITSADDQTSNGVLEKYCYNNDPANCITYGGLYQWAEAVQYQNGASNTTSPNPAFTGKIRGICPTGWHLPSDADWSSLETTLGGLTIAGGVMKSKTSGLWASPNTGATNSSGFYALPGGIRYVFGQFYNQGYYSYFWSSSEYSATESYIRNLYYYGSNLNRNFSNKVLGFSVRCLKD